MVELCTLLVILGARNEILSWDLHHCDQHEWSIQMMSILQ